MVGSCCLPDLRQVFKYFFFFVSFLFLCGLKSQRVICGKRNDIQPSAAAAANVYLFWYILDVYSCLFVSCFFFVFFYFFFFSYWVCLLLSYKDFYCLYHLFNIFLGFPWNVVIIYRSHRFFFFLFVIKYWQHPFARYSYYTQYSLLFLFWCVFKAAFLLSFIFIAFSLSLCYWHCQLYCSKGICFVYISDQNNDDNFLFCFCFCFFHKILMCTNL